MKSFPREEIISAQYETSVTVQCEASGFPRPTVTFLINGVNSYAENKGHTIMEPYKTTVTYVVTMPSDVECHISNRMGNTFWRIKVNLKGKSFNKKFKSRVWMRYMFRVHHFSISFYGNSLKSLHEKGIVVWRNQIFPMDWYMLCTFSTPCDFWVMIVINQSEHGFQYFFFDRWRPVISQSCLKINGWDFHVWPQGSFVWKIQDTVSLAGEYSYVFIHRSTWFQRCRSCKIQVISAQILILVFETRLQHAVWLRFLNLI